MPVSPSGPARPPSRLSLLFAACRGGLTGFVAAALVEVLYVFVGTNVHVVAPGYVYRSARLDAAGVKSILPKYGIRTVVNLTGCCDPLPPYLEESRVIGEMDVCQEDISFSACRMPPVPAVRRLIEVLDHCDYPVLFHCHRGIDRTGMAAAVALLLHTDVSLDEARGQLSLRYGHWSLGKTGQMDRFFDLYQRWLSDKQMQHCPQNFRRWAVNEYCPGECRCLIKPLDPASGPVHAAANKPFGFRVRCTNTSGEPWVLQPESNAGVHLGWILTDGSGQFLRDGRSGLFDAVVPKDGAIDLTVALPSLPPGNYRVDLDMVDEQHAWFYQTGAEEPVPVDVEVR